MSGDHRDDAASAIAQRVRTLEGALESRGLVSPQEIETILDGLGSPAKGARVVARAWVDDAFRARLLADGSGAIAELGYSMARGPQPQLLVAVANTETVHNVVVCTLCSCYPIALLGPSPTWYKSEAYRSRVVRDPRSVLREFGFEPEPGVDIRVWDASAETRYLVVPRRPAGSEGRDEAALAALVTRSGMIGTAAV